jgi:hypothetical protein
VGWTLAAASAIPVLVGNVQAGLSGDPDFAAVKVTDGQAISTGKTPEVVSIGWSGEEDDTQAEGTETLEGLGAFPNRTAFRIHCAVHVLKGTTDVAETRQRAADIMAAIGQVIAADPKLGGTVMRASISDWQLHPPQVQRGVYVKILFDVTCDAYSGR